MRGIIIPNVEDFYADKLKWNHLLLTGQKKKQKWRKSFAILMFIANNSIFKSIMS